MSDDSDPTPRVSQSFSFFRSAAEALAIRLESCAKTKSIPTLPHAYDRAGAVRALDLAKELRELSARFKRWPDLDPETVAIERPGATARLLDLQRAAEELLGTVPRSLPPRG